MPAKFEKYYTSGKMWGGRVTYSAKIEMARYYVWDHPDTLCLAFDGDHLIYQRAYYTDLKYVPTVGGWVNITSVLDHINIAEFKKVHLLLFNTPLTPRQRKAIEDIASEAKILTSSHPNLVADVLGW